MRTNKFRNRLAEVRKQAGMSQRELARRSGVSVSEIAQLERTPEQRMRQKTEFQLAAALGVHPVYLRGIDQPDVLPKEEGFYACTFRDDRCDRPVFAVLWKPETGGAGRFWRISKLAGTVEQVDPESILSCKRMDLPPGTCLA